MFFSDIIGQEEIKGKLKASCNSGRIAHAQMFFGPPGSGNLPMAIAYAQYIGCTGSKNDDSCGECPSCKKFSKLIHPDLHFAFPVNVTNKVSRVPTSDDFITEWREFVLSNPYFVSNSWYNHIGIENKQGFIGKDEADAILRKLNLKPFEAEYKFMIIWLPEKMNSSAANHLLKLLEEPAPNTVLLLVSDDPAQVMPTIASRTQPVILSRIDPGSLAAQLKKKFNLPKEDIGNIIRLSNGDYIKTLEIINSTEENDFDYAKFVSIMRFCWLREYLEINKWVEEMAGIGRERLIHFFEYVSRMVRENLLSNTGNTQLVYLTELEQDFSRKFHPYINGNNVMKLYTEINKAKADIERNGYIKLVLFDFSLKTVKLIRT